MIDTFADDIDYAQLVKVFGADPDGARTYSTAQCLGIRQEIVLGNPDPKHISTSYVERPNLNMKMQMRRFTRLTNAFSKKIENHIYALALFHVHHNFARVHQTLGSWNQFSCVVNSRDRFFTASNPQPSRMT